MIHAPTARRPRIPRLLASRGPQATIAFQSEGSRMGCPEASLRARRLFKDPLSVGGVARVDSAMRRHERLAIAISRPLPWAGWTQTT
jgi:hypothetical protein